MDTGAAQPRDAAPGPHTKAAIRSGLHWHHALEEDPSTDPATRADPRSAQGTRKITAAPPG